MLELINKIADRWAIYTSSVAFTGITMVAASRGIDMSQYTSTVEQLYAIASDGWVQVAGLLSVFQITVRKALHKVKGV